MSGWLLLCWWRPLFLFWLYLWDRFLMNLYYVITLNKQRLSFTLRRLRLMLVREISFILNFQKRILFTSNRSSSLLHKRTRDSLWSWRNRVTFVNKIGCFLSRVLSYKLSRTNVLHVCLIFIICHIFRLFGTT